MRTDVPLLILSFVVLIASCSPSSPPAETSAPPDLRFVPTATVKDIMDSVVDPNADYIWDSVAVTVSASGIEERAPQTDEEWKELRRHTIALLEATNLLLVPTGTLQNRENKPRIRKWSCSPRKSKG